MMNFVNYKNLNSLYINDLQSLSLQNVNMGGGIYSTKISLSNKYNNKKQYTTNSISIIIKSYINLFKSYIFLLKRRLILLE